MKKKNRNIICVNCNYALNKANIDTDFKTQNKHLNYYYCPKCGLIQIYPLPKKRLMRAYFVKNTNQYQIKNFSLINRFLDSSSLGKYFIKTYYNWSYLKRVKSVMEYVTTGKILDIGCAQGNFLYFFSPKFWNKSGIEINPYLAKIARKNNPGCKIYNKIFEDTKLLPNQYDIITLWHVFEHMANPKQIINKITKIIKPNGYLMIEVPNGQSWYKNLFGKYWQLLLPENHLYFWTGKSISRLLKNQEFDIVKIVYPVFDSSFPGSLIIYLQQLNFPAKIAVHLGILSWPISLCFNLLLINKRDNMLIIARKKY